jgi:polar amino acid transport system substrate-binding protein/arginine/ornithine transport system substrate-binding protein
MKMKLNPLLSALTGGLMAFGIMIGTAAEAEAEVLRIGVEGAYRPFSWQESDGTLKGFDIDIAHALCAQLNRQCELVPQDWDGMIPALLARKFDAIIASMSITEERQKKVDFSDKYYQTPAQFVARKGTSLEPTVAGMAGKRVGVQRGTTHQCFLERLYPDSELVLYGTQEEVFQDLTLGRIDAQFSDSMVAYDSFLKMDAGKDYAFLGGDLTDIQCHGEGVGIAIRKGSDELKTALNGAIKALRANGTYKKINDAYFDFDIYGSE